MFSEHVNEKNLQAVRAAVADDPNVMLDQLAETTGIPEGAVAVMLEPAMCTALPARAFNLVWSAMTQWEKITFITRTAGAIIEVKGRLPQGESGHGFFNIGEPGNPLGGHIRVDAIETICLVSKPFMGLETHSVRFYGKQGALLFAVYVGRNGTDLVASARDVAIGFWVDRGRPDKKSLDYMRTLAGARVGLFGTLGAKPGSAHAEEIIGRATGLLAGCRVEGSFLCQGRIDPGVVEMMQRIAADVHPMTPERIANIEAAAVHPDDDDIRNAQQAFVKILQRIRAQEAPCVQ